MKRLEDHAHGTIELTQTQIAAARIFLSKTIPDLSSVQHKGDADNPISTSLTVKLIG